MRNIQDQMKTMRAHTSVSNHKFFNLIAMAIKKKLEQDVPGLVLQFGGKSVSNTQVSAHLVGSMIDEDGSTPDKVRRAVDDLKNPTDLLSMMK